jgi:hypothetical protein
MGTVPASKALAADVAFEGFMSLVDFLVSSQVLLSFEATRALPALEFLHFCALRSSFGAFNNSKVVCLVKL